MAPRLVKCYGTCEQKYPATEMKKIGGANFCITCYDAKNKDTKDREDLYKYLQETFDLSFPTGLMLRQIKEFKRDRGYSYKNIRFTVHYMITYKKLQLQSKFGIAMVPHCYDEMIAYYKNLQQRRANTVVEESKVKRIKIKQFDLTNDYIEKKLINMEELLK